MPQTLGKPDADRIALILRLGLGLVFVVGGWWKLSRAIDPSAAPALVERYLAPSGYINAFFADYLFAGPLGGILDPLSFLILLSGFELLAGLALIAGLLVRSLSFVFAFLLWSFVIALPVVTVPGVAVEGTTHFSPALLVQIRDIGMSGLFFVLFAIGSGSYSLDRGLFARGTGPEAIEWSKYGLIARLAVGVVFLIGGLFAGFDHIKSFVPVPSLLAVIGIIMISGHLVRLGAVAALVVLLWYCVGKISLDMSMWNNLNAIKRELAFIAASIVLIRWGGGAAFRPSALISRPLSTLVGLPLDSKQG